MKLQTAIVPNSCFITSLAMCIDEPVENLLPRIPPPDCIIWSDLPKPKCCRGHHPAEMMYLANLYGYSFTEIVMEAALGHDDSHVINIDLPYDLFDLMRERIGIILLPTHAVACTGSVVFDPKGYKYDFDPDFLPIRAYYIVEKIKRIKIDKIID